MTEPSVIASNVPEFSVGELALSLKRTVEETYGRVRVRGELSRVSIAASGHMYSSLKDDQAVIDAVCWKGVMSKLSLRPEEGLEVICTGRLSTYPQRSNYQLIIETMELAGEGALLKMLEQRKQKLAAEGLFDPEHKKPLPMMPQVIGVVTSPTGAVIRDILHRLRDRFPVHVLLWPAKVQGDGAADEIVRGIEGLQHVSDHGLPQPDVIIVARGGGSLEDLMAFNEETVVRAVFECSIPVVSAVGHETDTTLIDYASDLRAPTPTAAAELCVPVRRELLAGLMEAQSRLLGAVQRQFEQCSQHFGNVVARLSDPARLLEVKSQALDYAGEALQNKMLRIIAQKDKAYSQVGHQLRHPRDVLAYKSETVTRLGERLAQAGAKYLEKPALRLEHMDKMLEAYSFQNVLKRGYAVVRNADGALISRGQDLRAQQSAEVEFYGADKVSVSVGKAVDQPVTAEKPKHKSKKPSKKTDGGQTSLF